MSRIRKRFSNEQNSSGGWPSSDVAVIGISCRLPSAADPAALWDLLRNGKNVVSVVPEDRWPTCGDGSGAGFGAFLDTVGEFDAAFFGISPVEAAAMDPQQRLMLELAWESLERSGVRPDALHGRGIGVFIGAGSSDYSVLTSRTAGGTSNRYAAAG